MTNKPEDTTHWYFALKLRWANRGSLQSSSSSKHILQVSEYGQFPLSIDYTQMVKWEEPLAFFMHRNIPSYPNQYRGGTRIQSLLKNHFLSLFFVFSFFFVILTLSRDSAAVSAFLNRVTDSQCFLGHTNHYIYLMMPSLLRLATVYMHWERQKLHPGSLRLN